MFENKQPWRGLYPKRAGIWQSLTFLISRNNFKTWVGHEGLHFPFDTTNAQIFSRLQEGTKSIIKDIKEGRKACPIFLEA